MVYDSSLKILFISDAIFFVGERKVEIYSAPTIPSASPICLTAQSLIKSRALSRVSNGTSIPVSSLVTGWRRMPADTQIPGESLC